MIIIDNLFEFYFLQICTRYLPREVDPLVYNMSHEDPGNIAYSDVGGLGEQIRELREVETFSILHVACQFVWDLKYVKHDNK